MTVYLISLRQLRKSSGKMDPKAHSPPSPPPAYHQTVQNTNNEQIASTQWQQNVPPFQYHHHQPHQPHQQSFPMQPQMPPPEPVVSVIVAPQVGPDPQMITCPSCRSSVITRIEYEPTTKTHIIAGLLCVFCCWCCVCVPYCVDSCKNGNHYCPSCGAYIGTYSS
ncbi:Lipopolysaccharide-induced tumor necrosis factor-alpha factor like [Pseudolycoriella hygida]|uniref:Lipopolysaccharide-induced tumor necrosis factor-alpha factor like n=1 Tax=Pseudolycoriella hygida TaxID=35572 RepID=A0A9Q0S3H7_9DIPT|nr:Lipopolysaccharide-induced tumor necrosis factor-alpha factor like [Pseudolycoriella hygida]